MLKIVIGAVFLTGAFSAQAQGVWRCVVNGVATYQDKRCADAPPGAAPLPIEAPAAPLRRSSESPTERYEAFTRRIQSEREMDLERDRVRKLEAQLRTANQGAAPRVYRQEEIDEQRRRCDIQTTSLANRNRGSASGSECAKLQEMLNLPPRRERADRRGSPPAGAPAQRLPQTVTDQHGRPYLDLGNGAPLIDQRTGRPCHTDGAGNILRCD